MGIKRLKLINTIQLLIFMSLFLLTLIIVILQISNYNREFKNQSKTMRLNFIDQQRTMIKHEVDRVVDMMDYEKSESRIIAKSEIKFRIDEAYAIAQNIYQDNRKIKSDIEIKKMIISALRPIRFNQGKGYFFITRLDGLEVLFSDKPDTEGLNLIDVRDKEGKYVVKDMIDIIHQLGEGYYEYCWTKPDEEGNNHKKIAYIKSMEFYDWFIGTGVYIEDIEQRLQETVGDYVTRYRFGKQKQDYVFVLDLVNIEGGKDFAIMYANANRPDIIGEYVSDDFKDANGKEFRKEFLKGLRDYGECYVDYWYKKIDNPEPSPKTSYFKLSADKKFIVAAGVYLDEVEASIDELQVSLNNNLKKDLRNTVLVAGVLLLFTLFFTYFIIRKLLADFSLFANFFKQNADENKEIDQNRLRFEKLYQMAGSANTMLRDKNEVKQRLLEEKEQLAVTLRSIGDAVITVNMDGRISLLNQIAEKLTGWKEKEAFGKSLDEVFNIIDKDNREKIDNPFENVQRSKKKVILADNTLLISKDKKEYNIEDSAAPIKNADNKIIGVVLVFRDVTEQLKREQYLIQSKKLESVGLLAGGIAHDFNNLLTGFFGNIEMAKMHISEDHKSFKYLDSAGKSIDRAKNLTKQLLTFSRGGDPITESISIRENIIETAKFSLRGSQIELRIDIDPHLWPVKADKGQISQVVSNLIINAQQSMDGAGIISISAKNTETSDERYIQFTVQDNGKGIAASDLENIFDPYFTTKQDGSGLGLASTYSIVNKHNGRINVDSHLNKGTTFTIELPVFEKSDLIIADPLINENRTSPDLSGRILILDDEEMIRDVIGAMLKRMGFETSFAIDGDEAVHKYKLSSDNKTPYDIVITDLTIPGGMGGQEAAQKILEIDPSARIIVSSGYATNQVMANYEAFGFKGIAVKPYSFTELKKVILHVLEK